MTIRECFKLSIYDIEKKKERNFRFFLNILVIFSLTSLLGVFIFSIQRNYNDLIKNKISKSYVVHFFDLDKNGNIVSNKEEKLSEILQKHDLVKGILKYSEINLLDFLEIKNELYLSINRVTMKMDGMSYQGEDDYSYDFIYEKKRTNDMDESLYSVRFGLSAVELSDSFYTPVIAQEYAYRYGDEKMLSCGRYLKAENEIVLSEYMLERFGVEAPYEQYIGKKISFTVEGKSVLENYVLVGIFNSNFFRVRANCTRFQAWIIGNHNIYKKYNCNYIKEQACTESFPTLTDLVNELDDMGKYSFEDGGEREEYEFIEKMKMVIEKVIYVLVLIVTVAVFLNLINHIYTDMQECTPYYGMLRAMGIRSKEMYLIITMRSCIIIIFAMLCSVVFMNIGVRAINAIMLEVFFMGIEITVDDYVKSILVVFSVMIVSMVALTYLCYRKMLTKRIVSNLKG